MPGFRRFTGLMLTCLTMVLAKPAFGGVENLRDLVVEDIRSWVSSPVVFLTLEASNARHADLDQAGIDALDRQWMDERGKGDQPLITSLLANPLSSYLTKIQADSRGLYVEIFVMDSKGLNAGQSAITSDFWQGDEAKWQKTYLVGPDAVFIDEIEVNEELGTEHAQFNLSIAEQGRLVGAITVEINVTELRRRRDAGKI